LGEHVDFPIPRIASNFFPDPIREFQFLIYVGEFDFGKNNTTQDTFIDINVPNRASVGDAVPSLIKDVPITHDS
jgi:hypothetical protein